MKVVIKQPNEDMEVKDITVNLKTLQDIVDGYIEGVYLGVKMAYKNIFAYGDDESKLKHKEPNFWLHNKRDVFCGTAIFTKENGFGEEIDLTDDDIKLIKEFLKENKI